MRKVRIFHASLVIAFVVLATASAHAQMCTSPPCDASDSYWIPFSAFGSGGGEMSAGTYTMTGLVGQSGAGVMSGGGYWNGGGIWYYDSQGHLNTAVESNSGSLSCEECSLQPGFPSWTDNVFFYEDYMTIRNNTGSNITMPLHAILTSLTPSAVTGDNTDGGGDRPPTGYWEYSFANNDGTSPGVTGNTLPPGESITRVFNFDVTSSSTFSFWADVVAGAGRNRVNLGRVQFSQGPIPARMVTPPGEDVFTFDDGTSEMHAGATSGRFVLANRFTSLASVNLETISFYTSGRAAGESVDVIIYEEQNWVTEVPDPSNEVWRTTVTLGSGGFQEVATDNLLINAGGVPGASFFVAVANTSYTNCSLGIDMTGPNAQSSYVSTDNGLTFAPLRSKPIIHGNVMIRAYGTHALDCFVEEAVR